MTTLFADKYSFAVGGRRFELFATPGGETLDSLVVWLPDKRTAFIGNLMGAIPGPAPPSTPRGDRQRSARQAIHDIQLADSNQNCSLRVTASRSPPGRDRAGTRKVRDAVAHIHDETVRGMAAGRDLPTLMAEIQLPPELEPAPGRGPVHWYVRGVWEEYSGWFRHESTTQLYPTPVRAMWPDIAELAAARTRSRHARPNMSPRGDHSTRSTCARSPSGPIRATRRPYVPRSMPWNNSWVRTVDVSTTSWPGWRELERARPRWRRGT